MSIVEKFDLIVIGSGYGGSVIAARMGAHCKLLLVERGRRWQRGDFPQSILGLGRAYMSARNPLGLWAMAMGRDTGNAFASAYGGGSVVNYGITSRPDSHVFFDWPISEAILDPYYKKALEVLQPLPNPIREQLGDTNFLDWLEPGRRVDIENTIDWNKCTQCGHCVPGCNQGAKRSLDTNYLAMAEEKGAEIRTETTVRKIEANAGGYRVLLESTGKRGEALWVQTKKLVLAAGTLGTLGLLKQAQHQSSKKSISLSSLFGQKMGMNGDGMAFLYDLPNRLSSHSGAPITTSVRLHFNDKDGRKRSLTVMSGRIPKSAMHFAGTTLATSGELLSRFAPERPKTGRHLKRRLRDVFSVGKEGALSHSFMYKLDGQDSNAGTANFGVKGVAIDWPGYAQDPIFKFAEEKLSEWAHKAGGTVIPNVATLPGMRSFGVHPLGGCRIGRNIEDGVVDDIGRVFNPRGGVYPGLRISDGSIIPGSPGVPPSLTIAALAERISDSLFAEFSSDTRK